MGGISDVAHIRYSYYELDEDDNDGDNNEDDEDTDDDYNDDEFRV
jgi:hypothetical protein